MPRSFNLNVVYVFSFVFKENKMTSKYRFIPDVNTGFLSDDDTKKYISRLAISFFALEMLAYASAKLFAFALSAVISMFAPHLLNSADFLSIANNLLNIITIYCVGLPAFCAISSPLPKVNPYREKLGFGAWMGGLCVCVFAMTLGNSLSNSVIIFVEQLLGSSLTNPLSQMLGQSSIWIDVVFVAIIVPVLEELLFRKLLCDRLLPLGEGYAIILSGVIFGLSHGNLFQFFYAFFVGAIFALVYVKTGKIIYTILYHVFLNFTGGVVVTLVTQNIDYEGLNSILYDIEAGTATPEQIAPYLQQMMPLLIYELVMGVLAIVGAVLVFRAIKRKTVKLEAGILPPPKKHRVSNIMCTVGTAALVTAYVFFFVLSVLPTD